jgi:hypothetical protein
VEKVDSPELCRRIAAPVAAAVTVPVVHEQMHQRAGQEQKIWQYSEDMRRVLGEQEEAANDQEAAYRETKRRSPPPRLSLSFHFAHLH